MMVTRLLAMRWDLSVVNCLSCIVAASRGDSIGGMPVDARLQAILDTGKALGRKPVELQTPAEARAERAEMVAQFVPMLEYAGVRVEDRVILAADSAGEREIALRVYRPATGDGPWPIVVFFHGGG